jgi:NAD(P)-dependent dehydrogenase (short-subunit alcohol dehydrogenase family)
MKKLQNKVAAITGAASGIGRMLAARLAMESCNLALADIDAKGLMETEKMIGGRVKVSTHAVDVSKRAQVENFAKEAASRHGGVDIIINNAGASVVDTLEDVSYEDFDWVFGANFWGVVYGSKAFLPYLRKRPEGHIVNISSINAMVGFSHNGPYNASKCAVAGFTETLIQELDGSPIRVTCVHPGGIRTNIARNARFRKHVNPNASREEVVNFFDKIARTSAERAAKVIISGIKRNKRRILIGIDARFMDIQKRLTPVITNLMMGRIMKKIL